MAVERLEPKFKVSAPFKQWINRQIDLIERSFHSSYVLDDIDFDTLENKIILETYMFIREQLK